MGSLYKSEPSIGPKNSWTKEESSRDRAGPSKREFGKIQNKFVWLLNFSAVDHDFLTS